MIWTEGYLANCNAEGFDILTVVVGTSQLESPEGVRIIFAKSVVRDSIVRGLEEVRC